MFRLIVSPAQLRAADLQEFGCAEQTLEEWEAEQDAKLDLETEED
jgi:hypothetical protein